MTVAFDIADIENIGQARHRTPQRGTPIPEDVVLVSADSHWLETGEVWTSRFPSHLRHKAPRVYWDDRDNLQLEIEGKNAFPAEYLEVAAFAEQVRGMWNIDARLEDLDAEGVAKELLFPQRLLVMLHYPDLEVREWVFRAYNRYISEI